MAVSLSTLSEALKTMYLGPIQDYIRTTVDPFASRIVQTTDKVVGANSIVREARIGINGGAGAGSETGLLPTAAQNLYKQLTSTTKNMYGVISITDKALKGVKGPNAGSFINAFQDEIQGLMNACKLNFARQVYGTGKGTLLVGKANGSTSTVIEAATGDSVKFLLPGMTVDRRAASDDSIYSGKGGMRVLDVDHVNNKFTLDTTTPIISGDYFTVQGSLNYELTGLGKIFEAQPHTTETLYGLDRATYSWLRPLLDASFGAISEKKLQEKINLIEDTYNTNINHINAGNDAYGYYMDLMTARRAINDTMELAGGFTALKYNNMPVTRNKNLGAAVIDLYDTSLFSMDILDDWNWIEGVTGGVLTQVANYPLYTGTLAKYGDMMCSCPGALVRLSGVAAPAA